MLINIQFLRFIAAMLVVFYHTAAQIPGDQSATHGLFVISEAIGFAGVDVFFVISGFIMAHTTLGQGGITDGFGFARRRLARIYSGHWPFFFLTMLVFLWARPDHFASSNLTASFFLWPQPLNRTLLEITWTLSFELYFYALFSLIIWLVPLASRLKVCVAIGSALLVLAIYRHFVAGSFEPDQIYLMPFAVHFLSSPFIIEFFAGAILAFHLKERQEGRSTTWLAAGIVLFLGAGAVNVLVYQGNIEQGFHVVPRVLLFGSASAMIITGLVRMEQKSKLAPRQFSLVAGGASYAIYLSHILILVAAAKLGVFGFLAGLPFVLSAAGLLFLIAMIAAYSIWHYLSLEKPLHQLFRRWIRA